MYKGETMHTNDEDEDEDEFPKKTLDEMNYAELREHQRKRRYKAERETKQRQEERDKYNMEEEGRKQKRRERNRQQQYPKTFKSSHYERPGEKHSFRFKNTPLEPEELPNTVDENSDICENITIDNAEEWRARFKEYKKKCNNETGYFNNNRNARELLNIPLTTVLSRQELNSKKRLLCLFMHPDKYKTVDSAISHPDANDFFRMLMESLETLQSHITIGGKRRNKKTHKCCKRRNRKTHKCCKRRKNCSKRR